MVMDSFKIYEIFVSHVSIPNLIIVLFYAGLLSYVFLR